MYYGNYRYEDPSKKKPTLFRRILILLSSVCLLVSGVVLVTYLVHSAQNQKAQQELAKEYHQGGANGVTASQTIGFESSPPSITAAPAANSAAGITPTASPTQSHRFFSMIGVAKQEFKSLIRKNPDIVGWITIDGVVDQPIVLRNNTYYMTHDVNRNPNSCGAIFLDENHPLREDSQNVVLYGHNMKDQTMFGRLQKYLDSTFLRNHYSITFSTRYETFSYIIFAVENLSVDPKSQDFFCFWECSKFESTEAFRAYIDRVNRRSLFSPYLDVNENDTLLTLVTCNGNHQERLAIFARRMRPSDTPASIRHAQLSLVPRQGSAEGRDSLGLRVLKRAVGRG